MNSRKEHWIQWQINFDVFFKSSHFQPNKLLPGGPFRPVGGGGGCDRTPPPCLRAWKDSTICLWALRMSDQFGLRFRHWGCHCTAMLSNVFQWYVNRVYVSVCAFTVLFQQLCLFFSKICLLKCTKIVCKYASSHVNNGRKGVNIWLMYSYGCGTMFVFPLSFVLKATNYSGLHTSYQKQSTVYFFR